MNAYDPIITVCDECLQASCWHGEFMCETSVSAGIVDRHASSLIGHRVSPHIEPGATLEHPDYWNTDLKMKNKRLLARKDLELLGITDAEMLELS